MKFRTPNGNQILVTEPRPYVAIHEKGDYIAVVYQTFNLNSFIANVEAMRRIVCPGTSTQIHMYRRKDAARLVINSNDGAYHWIKN